MFRLPPARVDAEDFLLFKNDYYFVFDQCILKCFHVRSVPKQSVIEYLSTLEYSFSAYLYLKILISKYSFSNLKVLELYLKISQEHEYFDYFF